MLHRRTHAGYNSIWHASIYLRKSRTIVENDAIEKWWRRRLWTNCELNRKLQYSVTAAQSRVGAVVSFNKTMKERIFKCITTFSVITVHFVCTPFSCCVSDELASWCCCCCCCVCATRLVLMHGIVSATLCKLFPRALLCCCNRCWLFLLIPDTSRSFSHSTNYT